MKYLKMLGLAAIAAGALMAFVGASTASATELDCTEPAGTKVMCPNPTLIHATSEGHAILHTPLGDVECASTVQGKANTGGASETVSGSIEALTFTPCTQNVVVTVLKKGSLEIHTDAMDAETGLTPRNGTLTSTGTEVTIELFGFHCIFTTSNTDIGTVTGSTATGATATFDIAATIPRTGGRSGAFCGSSGQWTGSYLIDTPDWLDIT